MGACLRAEAESEWAPAPGVGDRNLGARSRLVP